MRKELKRKKKIKLRNKKLIKKYPWLMPRNRWSDEVDPESRYTYTELDALPSGWVRAFGRMIVNEINILLEKANYVHKYRILQLKEKYGQMRWYDNGVPKEIHEDFRQVIDKYTYLSENICAICGKPDVKMTDTGWVYPLCKRCYEKHINCTLPYEEVTSDKDTGRMADSYTIRRFSKDGNTDTTYDISETAEKIRRNYARRSVRRFR